MSDEDMLNQSLPEEDEVDESTEEEIKDEPSEEEVTKVTQDDPSESTTTDEVEELPEQDTEVETVKDNTEETSEETTEFNYEEEYKKVLAPLKANGKELTLKTIEDLRNLASMGANYTKKMTAIKPSLKVLKMLENNNLLDEDKLNYLIDLDKKNPEAIKKLLKDSELDPLDINVEEDSTYSPNTYNVTEAEVELDNVIKDIQSSPKFDETIDVISNKWDEPSKQVLVETPQIIKVINEHMELGIYDQINSVIERERMLGRLNGLSDIEAYKQVGDALQASNQFNVQSTNQVETTPVQQASTVNSDKDSKLKNRKRSASSTKTTPKSVGSENDFNPLSMSDEEFEKISNKYI